MLYINKISSAEPIDFAALELKKYLRMMMPEGGDVKILFDPGARDGFRLGLMSDLGLDTSDAEDPSLDDLMYIDCNAIGGIIAGSNPRAVLLAVYEYLRQNGYAVCAICIEHIMKKFLFWPGFSSSKGNMGL